jgi:putative FmdB family regulatory protein
VTQVDNCPVPTHLPPEELTQGPGMTYEYLCKACNHQWEAEQSIKEAPLKICPSCGAEQAQRQISRSGGFILKGGGWYSDLYSSAKPAGGAAPGSAPAPKAEAKSETPAAVPTPVASSDSKPSS